MAGNPRSQRPVREPRICVAKARRQKILLVALALCLLFGRPESKCWAAQSGPGPLNAIGGDFSLTDHNGKRFELSDYRGKVILLFFGYTSCTEACPIILGRINSVFKQLGADGTSALAVFISVDPRRDSQEVLKEYVRYFSARTVALTGNKEEIDTVVRRYGATYEIEKSNSALGYHVSHTTDIFLIDPHGALRARFRHTERASVIADEVRRLLR